MAYITKIVSETEVQMFVDFLHGKCIGIIEEIISSLV
jgi:hypothetical protein